jgi:hypothetical protein
VQFAREKAGLLREYNNKVLLLQNPFWRTRYVAEEHSHLRLLPGRIPKPAKEAMK